MQLYKSNTILIIIFIAASIITVTSIKEYKKEQKKTIVQANHFFSTVDKKADYNISDIEVGKPLLLLLKNDEKKSKYITDFTISLHSESDTVDCNFKKINDLCIIPKVQSSKINMIITCNVLPCELSWIIYQFQPKPPQSNEIALNLFTLHKSNDHLIAQISCNDPSVTSLDKDVTIYSQNQFRRIYKNNAIYVLFKNEQKGYVFFNIDQKSRACSQVRFKQGIEEIKASENITTDFILKDSAVSYQLAEVPKDDFQLQCSMLRLDNFKEIKSSLIVSLIGFKDQQPTTLSLYEVSNNIEKSNSFTLLFKNLSDHFENYRINFSVETNQVVIIEFRLAVGSTHLVQLGQIVYFNLKQDQKVLLKVVGDEEAEGQQKLYLIPKRQKDIKLSKSDCSMRQGCEVTIQANNNTSNSIFISEKKINSTQIDPTTGKGIFEFQPIQFIPINKKYKHKIRLGQNIFFKKQLKKDSNIQIHINNPNTIMYAACQDKCEVPNERCRERTGNYHHPFIYKAHENCTFLINVEGLQNTQFELTILEENAVISLEDGSPFSYTMDKQQQRVEFKIKFDAKSDISFNLVSPLNSLKMLVSNEDKPDEDTQTQTTDGYIFIEKQEMKNNEFYISIVKLQNYQSLFTHFTLIVSSKHANIRLQPTVTNYQTLLPSNYRQYVFQFQPYEFHILSLSLFNMKDKKINLQIKVSDDKNWQKSVTKMIDKDIQYLDVDEISKNLCDEQQISCELFLKITNKMQIQVDFSITLLLKNAVIEIKDGIWQTLPYNIMTTTTNFYFYPRHQNNNILISYNSIFQQMKIAYTLWKFDDSHINSAEWPFPKLISQNEQLHGSNNPKNFISIDHEQMKQKCWPSCILLLSFYYQQQFQNIIPQFGAFEITVSNNHIQIPQKQKISLTLSKKQTKYLFIDMKYIMDKQALTVYTNNFVGDSTFKANAYSLQHPTCPTFTDSDFFIFQGEFTLLIQNFKKKLEQKQMKNDKNIYLCLSVSSTSGSKISIQYTSDVDQFKKIGINSLQEISLNSNQKKYYRMDAFLSTSAKILRLSGFPFVSIKKCPTKSEHQTCMNNFKSQADNGKQIVVKTQSFRQQQCIECIYLFKFSTIQPAKVQFHLQATNAEMELKEKTILTDFLNQDEVGKYMFFTKVNEEFNLNIHVQQGQIQARLTNYMQMNLIKKSDSKNKIIHFSFKVTLSDQEAKDSGLINPSALTSAMMMYHITITSLDPKKATSYTLNYATGKNQVYLQDGVILDNLLSPNKIAYFSYYNEQSSSHAYFSLSMSNAAALNQLKIKAYYLEDPNDLSSKSQINLEKPTMSRKLTNPNILYSLPAFSFFIFQLTNPTSKQEIVSMVINHQQVILLPFDHQFAFQLHGKQDLNILVDVNIPGFLDIWIKKCDRAEPHFGYSFDYDSFINGSFMYETQLNQQPYFYYTVKANRIGTLYTNFKADQFEDSTLSLKVIHHQEKLKGSKMKPGRKGVLQFELIGDKKAKIIVPAADCGGNPCKGVKYFYLTSKLEEEVYSQLVCPSSFFNTNGFNKTTQLVSKKIEGFQSNKSLAFEFEMSDQSVFLGVKAVSENGDQVYYQPIQVASLWAKWLEVSLMSRFLMVFLVFLFCCTCIIFVRRASRKGYRPLDQSQN